eukprot:149045_1
MGNNAAVIVTIIVYCAIYTPLSIYQIWRLYNHTYRHQDPIEALLKRQTSLSLICCVAYCIQFIDLSLWCMVYTDWFTIQTKDTVIFISQFIHLLMQFVFTFFIVLRFWLLHFSVKYEMISANHHWKKIIDPNYVVQDSRPSMLAQYGLQTNEQISHTAWIINNKHTWGNLKFCLKTGGVVFIVLFVTICVSQTLHAFYDANAFQLIRTVSSMITYGIFLLIWSVMLAIYCRTPSFYDHIYVKQELSYLFHLMVGFFFVYIIFAVLFGFGNAKVYDASYFGEVLLLFHCVALGNLIVIHVFTYLPLSKLIKYHKPRSRRSIFRVGLAGASHSRRKIALEDVLKNEHGFSSMLNHLAKEFSTEVLLSIVEFTMFKKYLYDNVLHMVGRDDRDHAMGIVDGATSPMEVSMTPSTMTGRPPKKLSLIDVDVPYLVLPFEKLPKSAIVYNEDISNKEKCYLLYEKYIRPGSEYEINISGGLRTKYRDMLDDKTKWMKQISFTIDMATMADLFDKCNEVNLGLMKHSFTRFRNGKEWKGVVKAIAMKQSIDIDPKNYSMDVFS